MVWDLEKSKKAGKRQVVVVPKSLHDIDLASTIKHLDNKALNL